MDTFILLLVVILIIWLFHVSKAWKADRKLIELLTDRISRLEDRLAHTENAAGAPSPLPVTLPELKPAAPIPPYTPPQPAPGIPTPIAQTPPGATTRSDPAFPGFATQPVPSPVPPAPPAQHIPLPPPPPAPPPPPFAQKPSAPQRSISLEERLGQNWLNKLGIVTLVIGLALFLGYQLRLLGPAGKSAIGLTLSLALLVGGLFLERRERYRIFARAAIGGGWALTFFVTFALYHVSAMRVIHSQTLDLTLMLAIAAAMVAHSLHYKSQVITSLAFILAFVTVGLSDVTLFSLVAGALLAAGLVLVAARQSWFELALCGLVGVYLNHFIWLDRVLPNGGQPGHPFPEFLPSAGLILFYWLLFRLFYILRLPTGERQQRISHITAILNSVAILSLLKYQSSHPEWAFYGLLALGTSELVLAFIARRRFHGAFVVLSSIASVLLIAAIPFRFSGANWTLLWLLEAEVLFIAGIRLRELVFRRLGMLAAFTAAIQLFVINIPPIYDLRQLQPDSSHHIQAVIALLTAAVLFWLNSEFAPRRWPFLRDHQIDAVALTALSYLAAFTAALGLWVLFAGAWTIIAWLALMLVLGWLADKFGTDNLALQADALAVAAVLRAAIINFQLPPSTHTISQRAITIALAAALLYLGMRRRTRPQFLPANYIAPGYSWAAAALLGVLAWYELQPISIAVAWAAFGLVLFELGLNLRRDYLRHQASVLLAASFIRIFFSNLVVNTVGHSWFNARVYTVVPLIAAYFWVYQRLHADSPASPEANKLDRFSGHIAAWFGATATAALLYFQFRPEWIVIAWACLAVALLAAGWSLKRTIFIEQALVALILVAQRAVFAFFAPAPLASTFVTSRTFTISLSCALLLAALPLAFAVRNRNPAPPGKPAWLRFTLYRPEQPFFFVPFALLIVMLAVELSAGMITIGWSALGVLTFLFALTVGERSFRLAGLGLLLLGVAKIICIDIWHASPSDRYITLIVMGAALLLVSFLYSRYKETIIKYL